MVFEKCTAVRGILRNFGYFVVFYLWKNAPECTAFGGVLDKLVENELKSGRDFRHLNNCLYRTPELIRIHKLKIKNNRKVKIKG